VPTPEPIDASGATGMAPWSQGSRPRPREA